MRTEQVLGSQFNDKEALPLLGLQYKTGTWLMGEDLVML